MARFRQVAGLGCIARSVWLRSANRNTNNANNVGCVNSSGNVNNANANNGYFAAPDWTGNAEPRRG